jgi:hypothetical protein
MQHGSDGDNLQRTRTECSNWGYIQRILANVERLELALAEIRDLTPSEDWQARRSLVPLAVGDE